MSQTEEEHEGNGHHLHCCAGRCRQEPAAPPPDSARLGAVFTVTSTLVQVDAVVTDSRSGTLIYTMHATGLQTLQLDAQDRPTLAGGADAPLNSLTHVGGGRDVANNVQQQSLATLVGEIIGSYIMWIICVASFGDCFQYRVVGIFSAAGNQMALLPLRRSFLG